MLRKLLGTLAAFGLVGTRLLAQDATTLGDPQAVEIIPLTPMTPPARVTIPDSQVVPLSMPTQTMPLNSPMAPPLPPPPGLPQDMGMLPPAGLPGRRSDQLSTVTMPAAPGYNITYPVIPGPSAAPAGPVSQAAAVASPATWPGSSAPNMTATTTTGDCFADRRDPCCYHLFENLSVQFALDGAKGPEDLGLNGNFGLRGGINLGVPLVNELGIGLQIGVAANYGESVYRFLPLIDDVHSRSQLFTTIGLFQRTSMGFNYGFAWDFRSDSYWTSIDVSQWRGQVSQMITDNDELGFVGNLRDRGDSVSFFGLEEHFQAMNKVSLFWRHIWDNEIETRGWIGVAEQHGKSDALFPDDRPIHSPFLFGADFYVPLSDCLSLFGETEIITPTSTGTISATVGLIWYPGRSARNQAHDRFAPLLPLANNTSFAVDARP